jgi:hypothetical protein
MLHICILLENRVLSSKGGSSEATCGRSRVSHFTGGLISTFVFDILQIPSECIVPRCNPLATGLVDIEQNYWCDHGENYWQNEKKNERIQRKKTAQI